MFSGPLNIEWKQGAPASVGCYGHTLVRLNGLVYVGGGYEIGIFNIKCYDPVKNSWSFIDTPYCKFTLTTLNGNLLIAGGEDKKSKKTNQILKMGAGQLKNYTKMITARSGATAVGHKGMLIITGGWNTNCKKISSTELFDSNNGEWYICSDLPQSHSHLKSVIVDDVLYLLGGVSEDAEGSSAVYNASLDTLSTHAHYLKWNVHQDTPWDASAPVSVNETDLLILGGGKQIGDRYIRTSEVYKLNKISHSWEAMGCIPSARYLSAAVSTDDNRVIVIGGVDDKGVVTNTVWIGSFI